MNTLPNKEAKLELVHVVFYWLLTRPRWNPKDADYYSVWGFVYDFMTAHLALACGVSVVFVLHKQQSNVSHRCDRTGTIVSVSNANTRFHLRAKVQIASWDHSMSKINPRVVCCLSN
ncbi:hypothetical protein BDV41DRAFT_204491 [Aspergillus transmontanensis]|uniref:Uncharacterized protein n=1 Tax=Aspergillus transmontanensis TaxID=1034304 RepID=A0A5N6W2G8_9EURO|nr:hypothetical protein BDV41DRAFT_204491 [Aspergillus transmontanensis]